jgi:hypothetical protein
MSYLRRKIYQGVRGRDVRGRQSPPTYLKSKHDKNDVNNAAKRRLVAMLKQVPCKDCGQRFLPCAMDFDHHSGDKKFSVSQGISNHTIEELIDEINKCDVVCSNCHRIRTIERARKRGEE